MYSKIIAFSCFLFLALQSYGQVDTILLGFGESDISVTASDNEDQAQNTTSAAGYLPNSAASARFLTYSSLAYNFDDIYTVDTMGIEDWIDDQLATPRLFTLDEKIHEYALYAQDSTGEFGYSTRMWRYAWWNYFMKSEDILRQKVAYALSQIVVISSVSGFENRTLAFSSYYDMLLDNAFGNYRDLLGDVTFHSAMGAYLTYVNNSKAVPAENKFPDENYARELMQLFTIGLHELNLDGTPKLDSLGELIPTYGNYEIAEFAKVFTGLTWGDREYFNKSARHDTSYRIPMIMFNEYHEPAEKNLLNGYVIEERTTVDGIADINDALDNVFNHPNTAPFICKLLIQRLVTSNPPPPYVERVSMVFENNGSGVRGDLAAVIKAILLDPYVNNCGVQEDPTFGMLSEPFLRYLQIHKAFNAYTDSGNYRNDMRDVYQRIDQRPLGAPSVFNFFQSTYQPLGPINDADLYAPEFQLADSKSLMGYFNGLDNWIRNNNYADELILFQDENSAGYLDEQTQLDFGAELLLTGDQNIVYLIDRLNLLLARGNLSDESFNKIVTAVKNYPLYNEDSHQDRLELAILLIMASPEYLINR